MSLCPMSSKAIQSDGLFLICSGQEFVSRSLASSKSRSIIARGRTFTRSKMQAVAYRAKFESREKLWVYKQAVRNFTGLT